MTHYRIYILDPRGRIITGSDATRDSDAEAFIHAESLLLPNMRAEVWAGTRPVGEVAYPARPEVIELPIPSSLVAP